jgi:peptidoglycan/LPS O-acetylase OafA/YrhL
VTNPNYLAFLTNRIFRIMPGFVVASLVCALVLGPLYGEPDYIQEFGVIAYIKSLVTLKPPEIPTIFVGSNHPAVNGSMWTIAYEFKCYLLVLLIGVMGLGRYKIAWASICLASLFVFGMNKLLIINIDPYYQYSRFLVPFTTGGVFYLYGQSLLKLKLTAPIALLCFIISMYSSAFAELGLSIFFGCVILSFALYGRGFDFFNKFPDISYGIYLYAWPLNKIMMWYYPGVDVVQGVTLVFFASILAGLVSWYAVESQALKIKKLFLAAVQH